MSEEEGDVVDALCLLKGLQCAVVIVLPEESFVLFHTAVVSFCSATKIHRFLQPPKLFPGKKVISTQIAVNSPSRTIRFLFDLNRLT